MNVRLQRVRRKMRGYLLEDAIEIRLTAGLADDIVEETLALLDDALEHLALLETRRAESQQTSASRRDD